MKYVLLSECSEDVLKRINELNNIMPSFVYSGDESSSFPGNPFIRYILEKGMIDYELLDFLEHSEFLQNLTQQTLEYAIRLFDKKASIEWYGFFQTLFDQEGDRYEDFYTLIYYCFINGIDFEIAYGIYDEWDHKDFNYLIDLYKPIIEGKKETTIEESKETHIEVREPLPDNYREGLIYEIGIINKELGIYLKNGSDENIAAINIRVNIKEVLEYYLYKNHSIQQVYAYAKQIFNSDVEYTIARNFIELSLDIFSGKVYSTTYIDKGFQYRYSEFYRTSDLLDMLKSLYYNWSSGSHKAQNLCPTIENKNSSNYSESQLFSTINIIQSDFNKEQLYKEVHDELYLISEQLKSLYQHIENTIKNLDMADLYEMLSYKYKRNYSYSNQVLTDLRQLENGYYDFIENRTKYELCVRVERSASANMGKDIYQDLLSDTNYGIGADFDTKRKILWAWNYIIMNQPEELDIENKREQDGYIHLIDVLPSLADYYKKRYSTFEQRYNNPKRKRYFSDQTEIYAKNKSLPAAAFFAKKKNSIKTDVQ